MLVFLIHGVATQDAGYGDQFKRKVKENLTNKNVASPVFYLNFWGHTFKNKTDQLFNWVRADVKDLSVDTPRTEVTGIPDSARQLAR
ncbi:MAG TPA: hypothetical protein DCZ88_16250 [Pseudanabaena sp.]|nr:hypothetical protein [Pseudanabaena sp.]